MSLNPLVIEQDASEAKLAFEVHHNSALHSIRLVRAKLNSDLPQQAEHVPIAVEFGFRSKQADAPPGLLRIAVSFRMTGTAKEAPTPVVSIETVFEADYLLREGYTPEPTAARAFKDGNAIFNLWPYFREYLQNTLQRMGLPPLAAPFLRLQPAAPKPVKRRSQKQA